jgi:hypothetical protein
MNLVDCSYKGTLGQVKNVRSKDLSEVYAQGPLQGRSNDLVKKAVKRVSTKDMKPLLK